MFRKPKISVGDAKEVRRFKYDTLKMDQFIESNPYYQLNDSGIEIPMSKELITTLFHHWRNHGPKQVKAKFLEITNQFITVQQTFVPVRHDGRQEWLLKASQ